MPRMDAFASASSSGCSFGKLCKFAGEAGPSLDKCGSCGAMHHHISASENKWLKWISDDKIEGRKCFDCWLLEASLKGMVHTLQLQPYYKQLADWSRISISPFSIGVSVAAFQLLPSFNPRSRLWPAELRGAHLCVCAGHPFDVRSLAAAGVQDHAACPPRVRLG